MISRIVIAVNCVRCEETYDGGQRGSGARVQRCCVGHPRNCIHDGSGGKHGYHRRIDAVRDPPQHTRNIVYDFWCCSVERHSHNRIDKSRRRKRRFDDRIGALRDPVDGMRKPASSVDRCGVCGHPYNCIHDGRSRKRRLH